MIQRIFVCAILIGVPVVAATCESLASLKLTNTTFTAAQVVEAGAFAPPGAPPPNGPALAAYKALPAFCRVQGVIQPSSDSHIEFEVWLPASGWNGKYLGVGNGGFAGSINYFQAILPSGAASNANPGLADAIATGYAASSTDTGHKGIDAKWALGHPEEIVDFGDRAVHETAERSRAIIRAFYGEAPKHSYFNSCSNGGAGGPDGSPKVPSRLRWDYCWCARELRYALFRGSHLECAGDRSRSGCLYSGGEVGVN
jgi:feruloyl esterase